EVERVADDIAMMFHGQVKLTGALDEIVEHHRRLVLRFAAPQHATPKVPGVLSITGSGQEWTAICNGGLQETLAAVNRAGGSIVAEGRPTLDEIFVARASEKAT